MFPNPNTYPSMSCAEGAAIAGCTARHLRDMVHAGKLQGVCLGRCIRINRKAFYEVMGISQDQIEPESVPEEVTR